MNTGAIMTIIVLLSAAIIVYYACRKLQADRLAAVALQRKADAEAFAIEQRTLRELAYDGCAFAFEQEAKAKKAGMPLTSEQKKSEAIGYVLRVIDWAEEWQVSDVVESCLAKVTGAGASGSQKI